MAIIVVNKNVSKSVNCADLKHLFKTIKTAGITGRIACLMRFYMKSDNNDFLAIFEAMFQSVASALHHVIVDYQNAKNRPTA